MSLTRRRALLTFAERHGAAIVEDDYDSEYRYDDRPLEPLHALDRSGRVIYLGTFSKTLSPSLRLGFAVFPESLVDASIAMRELMDLQPPFINQQAMVRFIADGHLERHLRKCRKIYRPRHQMVTEFVNEQVATGRLRPVADSHAGLHLAAHLPEGEDGSSCGSEHWPQESARKLQRLLGRHGNRRTRRPDRLRRDPHEDLPARWQPSPAYSPRRACGQAPDGIVVF